MAERIWPRYPRDEKGPGDHRQGRRDVDDDVLLNQSLAAQRRGAASLGAVSETQVGVVRAKSGLVAELRGHHDRDEHAWQFDA